MLLDSTSIPHWKEESTKRDRSCQRAASYQATTDEQNSDRDMLQITSFPRAAPIAEMLQEDVRSPVEEDEAAFNELG